jgi:hypothetical protein
MIGLNATNKSIEVVLDAASVAPLDCAASWRVIQAADASTNDTLAGTNGTTAVNLVPAPASGERHLVEFLSVYNSNSASSVVTIRADIGGTKRVLIRAVLAQFERLEYAEGRGWAVYASSGAIKHSLNQGTSPAQSGLQRVVLGADVTNNNAVANTIADVTGLSFPVIAGNRYAFRFVIDYTAAATTTGSRWTLNGPAFTRLAYSSQYSLTATSSTFNEAVAYAIPAASSASSANTTGNVAIIEGFIQPSANGDVIARFASEIASSAIVAKVGSYVDYAQL